MLADIAATAGGIGDLQHQTTDGWIVCQVVGQPLFARWAALVGEPDWIADARFQTDEGRAAHGALLSARMQEWSRGRQTSVALDALASARIPAAPVLKPEEVIAHPQALATDLFRWTDYGNPPRAIPLARAPVFLSETPGEIRDAPSQLGMHTESILGSIGYSAVEIAALRERGVV